jgi:hypothetical protein
MWFCDYKYHKEKLNPPMNRNSSSIVLMFQVSGTCMTQMVTLYGSVTTSSKYSLDKAGGFLQRMDLCSKYAFGKMPVIGSETPFKLKGL